MKTAQATGGLEGLGQLLPLIHSEIKERDHDFPIFHGAWDWHSSVHGHLVALRAARFLGRADEASQLLARLQSPDMAQELAQLRRQPDFEQPYGRAWLLLLLIEGNGSAIEGQRVLAEGLQGWLQGQDLAAGGRDYEEPCWPALVLHRHAVNCQDEGLLAWLGERVRTSLSTGSASLAQDAAKPGYFFSRWALQALVMLRVLGPDAFAASLAAQPVSSADLEPVSQFHSVHHMGINACRAWGLWAAYRASGLLRWRQSYERHVQASLQLHETWAGDRKSYGHWLPQFTVLAALEGLEDAPLFSG